MEISERCEGCEHHAKDVIENNSLCSEDTCNKLRIHLYYKLKIMIIVY